ncbi:chemotaxis protein CheB [Pedobacter sp. PLR]|uniref:chemotaxis protein CheB n=1 Tax=Pedobacter sp. PLR TaxID=2994465 RepID=UPI00224723F7|nr:chemotaxis protein CheB [Pedobacter sp. PLR]MCX2449717.1 chemotaxis protein CheB [Pedobacter sp. PLR]
MMDKKYLIALGASAGGLHALSEFFDNTLPDAVSYVITTHLYPHQKSTLTEIIQKHSSLQVCEVENDMQIQPNIIYVMPENKVMSIINGNLILTQRDLSIKVNMAIDIFFSSLAKDTMFKKIAVILSGMGKDGTKGVKMIAEAGGYVIAQSLLSAGEDSMPESVIISGCANEILSPKQMPQAIIDYVGRSSSKNN